LLVVAFLLVNAPNCHLSLVLASVVQGDAVNCNSTLLHTHHVFQSRYRLRMNNISNMKVH